MTTCLESLEMVNLTFDKEMLVENFGNENYLLPTFYFGFHSVYQTVVFLVSPNVRILLLTKLL